MKGSLIRWLALLIALLPLTLFASSGRVLESFDAGWRFTKGDLPGAEQTAFADSSWRKIDLPHDWSIEGPYSEQEPTGGPGGYLPTGFGWYRKHFQVPANLQGQVVSIRFDGVYMNSDVWINGHLLGHWPYGYSTFTYNLTPYLNFGDGANVIAVKVDNSHQPNSRWYSGSGIYRHVWISVTDPLHIDSDGITVTTPLIDAKSAKVHVKVQISNGRPQSQKVELYNEILTAAGEQVATSAPVSLTEEVAAAASSALENSLTVTAPQLWSPTTPNLYRLRTELRVNGETIDRGETTFGIRTVLYDLDHGLVLNGQSTKMLGMCLHHDGGAVGSAVPLGVLERRLLLLKEMGCNAIRTSHNPPAPELLDLCDRLGFLVMAEAFDEWTIRKPQIAFGYSNFFSDWYERDLVNFIHRDRNHPSIVLWSAGNEIGEQRAPIGPSVLKKLVDVFHREDPTRPVTAAMDNIFTNTGPAPEAFTDLLDIVGYNYVDRWLERREQFFGPDRFSYPKRHFIGTEDEGLGDARGLYEFRSLSANTPPRAVYASAMIRAEQLWKFALTHEYVIGHFIWTGFDYLGESVWPVKGLTSGALDTCGFPKDSYYFYQSIFQQKPMLHLFPHWNWAGHEGQTIPVIAYTNCEAVELFLNGHSLGVKVREFPRQGASTDWNQYDKPQVFPSTADLHLSWDVPYAPGELKAVGYREGQQVCVEEIHTAGAPTAIRVSLDHPTLVANAHDVANLVVDLVDAKGVIVPTAENQVEFALQGPAKLLGVDNGNLASHESYQAPHRLAFGGKCLAVIESETQPGKVHLTITSAGLTSATADIEIQPSSTPATLLTSIDK